MNRWIAALAVAVVVGLLPGCTGGSKPAAAPDGATLVSVKCQRCHSLDRVDSARYDAQQWGLVVDRMRGNGLVVTDDERRKIIEYLAGR